MSTETPAGTGTDVFTSDDQVIGRIRFLDPPEEVLEFVDGDDVEQSIASPGAARPRSCRRP